MTFFRIRLLTTVLTSCILTGCVLIHTRIFRSADLIPDIKGQYDFSEMVYYPIGQFDSYEGFISVINHLGGPLGIHYSKGEYLVRLDFRGSSQDTLVVNCDSMYLTLLPQNHTRQMACVKKMIDTYKTPAPRIYFFFGFQLIPEETDSLTLNFTVQWQQSDIDSLFTRPYKIKMLRYDKTDWVPGWATD